ncbi:uncharacterized protein CTRU02_208330 [Colletotrichum truncatum]|uniref:Uncharacterized protein n=1 Tax=Colletotrichum truncatum TaxID=5467 RepID=A0ACC3YVZ0_COLTU|nr:uncharacterized protein CTRU02_07485 [Colletotrichum truncatum]KAF6791146.1 hypothetical protein CTRU02_07485 [Colletotrichum truncatum]
MSEKDELADTIPPSYKEASQPGQDVCQPTTLVLKNQSIHALTPESPPLYRLSLGISELSEITTEVELFHVEPRKDGSGRDRHIYDLRCMRTGPGGLLALPSDSPRYYIQRATRRIPGLQDLGVKKGLSIIPGTTRSTAVPVDVYGKTSKYNITNFVKGGAAVFSTKGHEWTDAQGNAVAVMHDDTDKRHSLIVTAALPSAQLHMLVALWCCHVWEYGIAHAEKVHEGLDGGNFI